MEKIKIVFFDIDGTLISFDKDNISEKTAYALKELRKNKIKICIASGRAPVQIPHMEGVDFDCFLTFNGSLCFNKNEDIFTNPLKNSDVIQIIKNAKDLDKPIAIASKENYKADYYNDDLKEYFSFAGVDPDFIDNLIDFTEKNKIYQINLPIGKKDYERALSLTETSKIEAWWDRAVDIIQKDSGKDRGIRNILSYYGIKKEEALAFGDGNNDLGMFKEVRGIAMANASDKLKEISYDTCKSVDDDGIYHYLKKEEII